MQSSKWPWDDHVMSGRKGHPTASLKPWAKIDIPPFSWICSGILWQWQTCLNSLLWGKVHWSNSPVLHFFQCLYYIFFMLFPNWTGSDPLVLALCSASRSPISGQATRIRISVRDDHGGGNNFNPLFIWRQNISCKDPDLSPKLKAIDFNYRSQVQSVLRERLKPGNRRCVEASVLSLQGVLTFTVFCARM